MKLHDLLVKHIREAESIGLYGYDAEDNAVEALVTKGYNRADIVAELNKMDEEVWGGYVL